MLARQIAIGFGVAVIFPLLVFYGASTFYGAPKWRDFFGNLPVVTAQSTPEERKARDELQRVKQQGYETRAQGFAYTLILVATPLGIAAMLIGSVLALHSVGTGLILGGILTVATGYYWYWIYLEDWVRFLSLLLGFAILIFVGYRHSAFSHGRL